jgi:hypothetical protein
MFKMDLTALATRFATVLRNTAKAMNLPTNLPVLAAPPMPDMPSMPSVANIPKNVFANTGPRAEQLGFKWTGVAHRHLCHFSHDLLASYVFFYDRD